MKTLGILGGMSWVSTAEYYRKLNQYVQKEQGKQHSASLLVASVDFQEIVDAQVAGDWQRVGIILAEKARGLERAGADAILIASNTIHKVASTVRAATSLPFLDIFTPTAEAIKARGLKRVALLGTRYTMSDPYFVAAYARHGVEVFPPEPADAAKVNEIIFRELIQGEVLPASRAFFQDLVTRLGGAILGCTELGLVVDAAAAAVPIFDTTEIHVAAAGRWLL